MPVDAGRRGEWLLLCASMAATLGVLEGGLRLLGLADPRPRGYAPVKTEGRERWPINSEGFRDGEHAQPKPPGVRRAVCVGDSFTWGVGVEMEDAWPRRLERALRRKPGGRWEVVNLALVGMDTAEEADRLLGEGLAYEPDLVVVGFCLNDAEPPERAAARFAAPARREPPPGPLRRAALNSALFRFVAGRLEATAADWARIDEYRSYYQGKAPGWRAAQRGLERIGAACRQRGIPWALLIFPLFANPLDDGYPFADLHPRVAAAGRQAGALVVDLREAYRGLRWELLVVDGAEDEHPNEVAHRIAARTLAKALLPVLARARRGPAYRPSRNSSSP